MNFQELINQIVDDWQFDAKNYPGIESLSEEDRRVFVIRHVLLHQQKALGLLAEAIERCEHKGADQLNLDQVKAAVAESCKNTLRLAGLMRMSAGDLANRCTPQRPFHDPTYG